MCVVSIICQVWLGRKEKKNISVDLYMYFISVYAVVQKMDEKAYTIKYAENAFGLSSDIW